MKRLVFKIVVVERRTVPRYSPGVDHGSEANVIVEDDDGKKLLWRLSCNAWADNISGYQPFPAHLDLLDAGTWMGREVCDGGRLTIARLAEHSDAIDSHFGAPVSRFVHPRRTVLVERPKRPPSREADGSPATSMPIPVKLGTQPALVYLHPETPADVGKLILYKEHPCEPWAKWLGAYVDRVDPIPFLEKM